MKAIFLTMIAMITFGTITFADERGDSQNADHLLTDAALYYQQHRGSENSDDWYKMDLPAKKKEVIGTWVSEGPVGYTETKSVDSLTIKISTKEDLSNIYDDDFAGTIEIFNSQNKLVYSANAEFDDFDEYEGEVSKIIRTDVKSKDPKVMLAIYSMRFRVENGKLKLRANNEVFTQATYTKK